MKLYMVPLAPNPTKIMLYLAERAERGPALDIEQTVVNTLKGRHREAAHLARNPFGTLPVLELNDGSYLIESLSIIQFLEAAFPEGALLPADPLARARALELERIVELKLAMPMGRYVHATNSPLGRPPDPSAAADAEAAMAAPLAYVEALLADGRDMLGGADAALADFTLQAALQFMRFAECALPGDLPNLRAWDARYRARPAARAVLKW